MILLSVALTQSEKDPIFCVLLYAGVESTRNVPAGTSSFTIDGLQSDSGYTVFVSPMIGSREGSPASVVIRTGESHKTHIIVVCLLDLAVNRKTQSKIVDSFCFASQHSEPDQSAVGPVTSLQVQETRGEVVRVTWVGVQGATAYRVSWRRTDGTNATTCLHVHYALIEVLLKDGITRYLR